MPSYSKTNTILRRILLSVLLAFFAPVSGHAGAEALFPLLEGFRFREVPLAESLAAKISHVRQEDMAAPVWKKRWDEARRLAVAGELLQASDLYRDLLEEKEVAEARWEMVTILLSLGRGGEAIDDIESLCEENPNHPGYLRALAVSNISLRRFRAGAEAFRRLLAMQPASDSALAGLIYSLLAGGEKFEAVSSMSALVERYSRRLDLREALATLAYEVKDYTTAWPHLFALGTAPNPSPDLLAMAAKVSEVRQLPEQAAKYWQRYVTLRPDDLEARQWLAEYYFRQGKTQQVLSQLEEIRQRRSGDHSVLKRIGLGYLELKDHAKAAAVLSEYVSLQADDSEAAQALVAARQPLGNTEETLRALERYFAVEPQPDQASMHLAARLYDSIGAHGEVVAMCRRLLVLQPEDPAISTVMAQHLEATGRDEEALAVWRQLARRSPSSIDTWRRKAVLLERLDHQQELYQTLARLHELEPADNELSLRLVAHFVESGALGRAIEVIADMERFGHPLPEIFYYRRGELHFHHHDYAAALSDLERFLGQSPEHEKARLLAVTAAGRLGDTARVREHHQILSGGDKGNSASLLLHVAETYADCRAESEARDVLLKVALGEGGDGSIEDKTRAYAGLAESFVREKRFYEAEQSLRVGLVVSADRRFFLPRLVALALSQGRGAEAEEWLAGLRSIKDVEPRRLALLEAAILVNQGELRKVRNILTGIEADWGSEEGQGSDEKAGSSDLIRDRLQIASLWIKADKPQKAALQCRKVLTHDPDNLAARVLLEKIRPEGEQVTESIDLAGLRFDQLCDLAEVYLHYGMADGMVKASDQALRQRPDSVKAGVLLTDAFAAQGKVDEALRQMTQISAANPDDFSLKVRVAVMQFMRGETELVEALVESDQGQSRPDLLLLQARALWRHNRWDEALQVYRDFLSHRVADRLRSLSRKYGENLSVDMRNRSVWEVLTRDPGPDRDVEFTDLVMTPARTLFFLDRGAGDFALAASRFVAIYRWQAQFAMEYAPRQSVVREEYTIAQKQYEALIGRYPQEKLPLFDLAGMHSVLGNLGEEAAAYAALDTAGIRFPELSEAVVRNQLKQQPKVKLVYGYQNEAGRNGYVDRDKNWQGVSFWNSFKPLHDGEMTLERINYHAENSSDVVRATRLVGSYSAGVLSGLTVRGDVGVQGHERTGRQVLVADAAVVGKLGDGLTGTLSYVRDVVDDTTASVQRNILYQDLLGGITLEPLPRLAVGGGYLARDYSDNNWTAGYDLWASFLLFTEPMFLQLKYSYDFKESREGALAGEAAGTDGFSSNDHPYWAPRNYWLNQVGLFFKHSLVNEPLGREAPRYYTIEYLLGHDVDGYLTQTAKASVFAECNPNLLVEAGTELTNSQSFRRQEYRVGISYRW